MNHYILIGDNGKIAEAHSLDRVRALIEEAESHGFDVIVVIDAYSGRSVMDQLNDEVNSLGLSQEDLSIGPAHFDESDIPY